MSINNGRLRKEQRRKSAQFRQKEYEKTIPSQQLAKLDKMFGEGMGATKEREKLSKKMGALDELEYSLKQINKKNKRNKKNKNRRRRNNE